MMQERWKIVPVDFDEARRFATEYEIEAGHAIDAQPMWALPEAEDARVEALCLRNTYRGPRASARADLSLARVLVDVDLVVDRLHWKMQLKGGEPYELPASVVERFAADYRRLCGMGD